jgi:hypothetical protein
MQRHRRVQVQRSQAAIKCDVAYNCGDPLFTFTLASNRQTNGEPAITESERPAREQEYGSMLVGGEVGTALS